MSSAAPSPVYSWLGLRVVAAEDGSATVELPTRAEMANSGGVVHGGFIGLLADSAMGRAMASVLPSAGRHLSFDLKVSFISPAEPGETLRAAATVVHRGRRTGVAECRVESEGGRLVATASGTFVVSPQVESPTPDGGHR
jgi:uncharacterized protein (TIGR00369 family)